MLLYPALPASRALARVAPVLLILAGCPGGGDPAETEEPGGSAFRIRLEREAPLNADGGWAAPEGETAVVRADEPFRIRFEVEIREPPPAAPASEGDPFLRLQARRNGGPWLDLVARDFPYPDEISSPRVSVVGTRGYPAGSPTRDLLSGSDLPFRPGIGVSLDSAAPAPADAPVHGEWEWPVVIRRFADGAVTNDDGDLFEFRMRGGGDAPGTSSGLARVRLRVPPGHLGGTFVETPGRLGPWQSSDGGLYFIMEPAETDNVLMMVSSRDGGRRWTEVDGSRRPATVDLEGLASALHDGAIHILHQTSEAVVYHRFRTSDAPEGEGWEIRDEEVAGPGEPPVQVATLEVRDDGSAVAVYGGPDDLRVRVRDPRGVWGEERRIPASGGHRVSGPSSVLLPDGRVALAYTTAPAGGANRDDEGAPAPVPGRLWLRIIDRAGIPGPPLLVSPDVGGTEEASGALAPLVYLHDSQEVVTVFRGSDGHLLERRADSSGTLSAPVRVTDRRVVQNAVDSDQVGADAVVHDGIVHVLFIDEATGAIRHSRRLQSGEWTRSTVVLEGIEGQWVRGAVVRHPDGEPVYGFVYDAGSDGGSGMNRYAELPLEGGAR